MTDRQRALVLALGACRLGVGSTEKRFIRDMHRIAANVSPEAYPLSEKQTAYLEHIAWRYRKQLSVKRALEPEIPEPTKPGGDTDP